jgi:hypothetical protein
MYFELNQRLNTYWPPINFWEFGQLSNNVRKTNKTKHMYRAKITQHSVLEFNSKRKTLQTEKIVYQVRSVLGEVRTKHVGECEATP